MAPPMLNSPWGFGVQAGFGFGIFSGGKSAGSASPTNKYAYSNDSVSNGTSLTSFAFEKSTIGNASLGIFSLGSVGGNAKSATDQYIYSNDSVSSATNLTIASPDTNSSGNSTVGIFALNGGFSTPASTNKYIYSNNSVSAATSLINNGSYGDASGNSIIGIFAIGYNGSYGNDGDTPFTNKYTYSNDSVISSSNLIHGVHDGSSTGNNVFGIFTLGSSSTPSGSSYILKRTNKYNYSSDSVSSSSNLTKGSIQNSATGDSTRGIFAIRPYPGDSTRITNKYIYSSNSVYASTSLTVQPDSSSAVSASPQGVNI